MEAKGLMSKAILILVLGGMAAQAGLSKLDAISMIESGDNDWAVGDAGEVSRYQIMPGVWKRYTSSRAYHDAHMSGWVANLHLQGLEGTFRQRTGREANDFDRYVLWNGGPTYYAKVGFSATRVHPIIRERAQRFVNLREKAEMASRPVAPRQETRSLRSPPILAVGGFSP